MRRTHFELMLSLLVALMLLVGCAGRPPSPEPSDEQFRFAGARQAIQLSVEGLPVDQPVDQQWDESTELTLAEATHRALMASTEIQSALARAHAAWAEAQQQRLLPNPIINVAVRFPNGGGDAIIEAGISEDLLAILTMPRRVSSADQRLRAATAEVLVAVLGAIATVQETYLAAQAADARLAVLEDRKKLSDRLYEIARSRVEVGEAGQLDRITAEADRATIEIEIAEQIAERRQRRLELSRLMGEPSGPVEWKLPAWSSEAIALQDERALIVEALTHRPEVQSRRWELAALGDDLKLAEWSAFEGLAIGAEAERENEWSVGPSISTPLPIFDWGRARRDKAYAQLIEARHQFTQTQRQIIQDVRQALAAHEAAQLALEKTQRELIPLQERRREQADAAYRAGLADITTVVLAEQDAQATRAKLIELQGKSSLARIKLVRAVGGSGVLKARPSLLPATQEAK